MRWIYRCTRASPCLSTHSPCGAGCSSWTGNEFDFAQEYLEEGLARAREADLVASNFTPEPSEPERLDLSGRWVALVGGYAPMRHRVCKILTNEHNLERFTEVPPSWEERVDQARVAEAVRGADLIVVVHRCIKHD